LKNGVEATGTPARLAALVEAGVLAAEDAASLSADVTFLLDLLLRHQIDRISARQLPDNCVKPESLHRLERERPWQVCREIDRWRQRLVADYSPGLAWASARQPRRRFARKTYPNDRVAAGHLVPPN